MLAVEELAQALVRVLHDDDDNERATQIIQVIKNLLLFPALLIKPTQQIDEIENAEKFMSMDHHMKAATLFFTKFHKFGRKTCAVVLGQKQQGKSQFLYFVTKLLIALGEGVVYLDQTIAPRKGKKLAVTTNACCLNLWQPALEMFLTAKGGEDVIETLRAFRGDPDDFANFDTALHTFCETKKLRVWMIVDEATSDKLKEFPITWPEKQNLTAFHFILTGSVGIADYVEKKHLETQVWELPLFNPRETADLALQLQCALNVPTDVMEGAFGLKLGNEAHKKEKIGEFLDGLFGGIPGYVADLFLVLSTKDGSLTALMDALSNRVFGIVMIALGVNKVENARLWLAKMDQVTDPWLYARNAGLCGSTPPRGAIFCYMLEALFFFAPQENELEIVKSFRRRFDQDTGLGVILMELEVILKLQHKEPIRAALIKLDGEQWVPETQDMVLPPFGTKLNMWKWNGVKTQSMAKVGDDSSSEWHCVLLPIGFCVLDVLLVHCHAGVIRYHLVQITQSKCPFHLHETNETCSDKSLATIKSLLAKTKEAICQTFCNNAIFTKEEVFYVMVAPNCNTTQFSPPARHFEDFLFSPHPKVRPVDERNPRAAKKIREIEETKKPRGVERERRVTENPLDTPSTDRSSRRSPKRVKV